VVAMEEVFLGGGQTTLRPLEICLPSTLLECHTQLGAHITGFAPGEERDLEVKKILGQNWKNNWKAYKDNTLMDIAALRVKEALKTTVKRMLVDESMITVDPKYGPKAIFSRFGLVQLDDT